MLFIFIFGSATRGSPYCWANFRFSEPLVWFWNPDNLIWAPSNLSLRASVVFQIRNSEVESNLVPLLSITKASNLKLKFCWNNSSSKWPWGLLIGRFQLKFFVCTALTISHETLDNISSSFFLWWFVKFWMGFFSTFLSKHPKIIIKQEPKPEAESNEY
jgi:hypothetical protein